MNAAAKSSTVSLYVAIAGTLTAVVSLLGATLRLLAVLVTSLTGLIQRVVARAAKARALPPQPVAAVAPLRTLRPVPPPTTPAPIAQVSPGWRTQPMATVRPLSQPADDRTQPMARVPWAVTVAPPALVPPARVAPPAFVAHHSRCQSFPAIVMHEPGQAFQLPAIGHLESGKTNTAHAQNKDALAASAAKIVETLAHYGVQGTVEDIMPGPTVTTYEVSPAAGTKVSKVAGLADDMALALGRKVRIVAPIPGKNRIGVELPNDSQATVALRDLIEDSRFQTLDASLPVVLGRDTQGNPVYADLASMPHAIVAGATGAGKSVGLNVMLLSLLYRRSPAELRLLLIDPKVVELAPFNRIPHMLQPVVTDMKQAATALKWAVGEMERRYQLFADAGTKNITSYNTWVERAARGEVSRPDGFAPMPQKLPWIVIVVDEFADLMMQHGKEVEPAISRLAQKARASGMHVILATQRPSVEVITGDIKANFPTRIAFRVSQKVDSRVILDEHGAEHLLGRGDMLVKLNGSGDTKRVQCPWVSEEEVGRVTAFLRTQGEPVYDQGILQASATEQPEPARRRVALRVAS